MDIKEIEKEIKQLKHELKLFLDLAEKLNFPKEQTEAQINRYPDTLNSLLELQKNLKD